MSLKLQILCPSAPCAPNATLIGIVEEDGRIALLSEPFAVDETFVAAASLGRAPEKRFRFASPCRLGACSHWGGDRCKVVDTVLRELEVDSADTDVELPHCAIRSNCRWHAQRGRQACIGCAEVITDLSEMK